MRNDKLEIKNNCRQDFCRDRKYIRFFLILCGIIIFVPNGVLCKSFNLLVGARGSGMAFFMFSWDYNVFAGIEYVTPNTLEQYEIKIAYGEAQAGTISSEWKGSYWAIDVSAKWDVREKWYDILHAHIKDYMKVGFFFIPKANYSKKEISDVDNMGPMHIGAYFGPGFDIGNLCIDEYIWFGGISMFGLGVGLTYLFR